MPDTVPQPNHQDPAPRRKSKPKFEVPVDAGQPADAGWVYRDDATAPAHPAPPLAQPPGSEPPVLGLGEDGNVYQKPVESAPPPPPREAHSPADPIAANASQALLTSAFGLFATGYELMTQMAMVAMHVFALPINMLRRRVR